MMEISDALNRLENKLEDTNKWLGKIQAEVLMMHQRVQTLEAKKKKARAPKRKRHDPPREGIDD